MTLVGKDVLPTIFQREHIECGRAYFDRELVAHILPQFRTWLDDRALSRLYVSKIGISDTLLSPS